MYIPHKITQYSVPILFTLGSIIFSIDGLIYLYEDNFTLHATLYTGGSVLFTLGSILQFYKPKKNKFPSDEINLYIV